MSVYGFIGGVLIAPSRGRGNVLSAEGGGALGGRGGLSSPVEGLAFDVGPHDFHAACVDQEACSSLHTSLDHILCA